MKDKIKSYNMTNGESYRNKIKGHVQIDLHDTRTGFNERIEKDNLVTNALDNYIPFCLTSPNSYFSPIATNALGGIMIFDGEITEDAANVCLPSDAHIVGIAGQTAETDSFFGTYNAEESGVIENGYTSVWDFATNQCNGQIGAVARTHASILQSVNYEPTDGSHELGSSLIPTSISSGTRIGLKYDSTNAFFYFFDTSDSKVKKVKYFPSKLGVCDEFRSTFNVYNLAPYEYEEVADLSGNLLSSNLSFHQPDGYAYQEITYQNSGGITVSITIARVDCENFTVEKKTFDTSPLNIPINSLIGASNGYFYYTAQGEKVFIKINWSNPADMSVVIKESDGFSSISLVENTKTGVLVMRGYSSNLKTIYIYPDGTVITGSAKFAETSSRSMQVDDGSWFMRRSSKIQNRMYEYLGTIANVGPFQKNSTQTMKITYSLTNASS